MRHGKTGTLDLVPVSAALAACLALVDRACADCVEPDVVVLAAGTGKIAGDQIGRVSWGLVDLNGDGRIDCVSAVATDAGLAGGIDLGCDVGATGVAFFTTELPGGAAHPQVPQREPRWHGRQPEHGGVCQRRAVAAGGRYLRASAVGYAG